MRILTATLAASFALAVSAAAQEAPKGEPSPGESIAAAPAKDWVAIAPADLLVMTLAPDRDGNPRQIVLQLMPPPFSQGWVGNIRKLAAAHWWDGLAITRVQDNYVVQWGDPEGEDTAKAKPLPSSLQTVAEVKYLTNPAPNATLSDDPLTISKAEVQALFNQIARERETNIFAPATGTKDAYAPVTTFRSGWPLGMSRQGEGVLAWPVHCYGMVGVGRNYSPDTGSGAELYTVIGHAPRHLDRNIALVGRVAEGIEHLSSLPRGTGALGFYEKPEQRVPIVSIRLASELPAVEQPKFEYLSTESASFAKYADARANRRDPFFIVPAGGADICNIPVPVRRVPAPAK